MYSGKRFFDRSTLRRHKKCIHENITHRCKFCSLEFSRRHYLTSHVHKEHPGKIAAETAGINESGGKAAIADLGGYYKEAPVNGSLWRSILTRVGKVIKPGLKKNGFYYRFFLFFFQMDFEKTRVFSGFFKFFEKKLTKTAKFEKKMKTTVFFIKKHVF